MEIHDLYSSFNDYCRDEVGEVCNMHGEMRNTKFLTENRKRIIFHLGNIAVDWKMILKLEKEERHGLD